MKCLSVRQPWAWLIVNGYKDVENRTWSTKYRGPVLIHASQTLPSRKAYDALRTELADAKYGKVGWKIPDIDDVPHGGIIGSVNLIDCCKFYDSPWAETGCYHWVVADASESSVMAPYCGALGLFEAPEYLITGD